MANSIDFLKQTKSLNQDTSLLSSENQTVKDKPSLFDSLLSGNKTTTTQNSNNTEELSTDLKAQSTNSALKEEIGKTKENLNSIKNKEELEIDLKKDLNTKEITKENEVVKEKLVSSSSSLLDRLVLEAKKDVKAVSQEQLKNIDNKTALTQDLNNTEEVSTDLKVQLTNSDLKKEEKVVSQEQLKNIDNKTALRQDLNNIEEVSIDSKVQLNNSALKEEIGKIKEAFLSL
jgi:hypothetical protein